MQIAVDKEALEGFCRRHSIRKLALFGSVLRDDFRPSSDVDVLVEFDPKSVPGFGFVDLQDELGVILGRKVDLNTLSFLSPFIRDRVSREALVLYDTTR